MFDKYVVRRQEIEYYTETVPLSCIPAVWGHVKKCLDSSHTLSFLAVTPKYMETFLCF